jgi:hypothetical protein
MLQNFDVANLLGMPVWLLVIAMIWSLVWMGIAMWKAAKKHHIVWFVVFLIFHTLGILEILYIFWFSKIKLKNRSEAVPAKLKKKRR